MPDSDKARMKLIIKKLEQDFADLQEVVWELYEDSIGTDEMLEGIQCTEDVISSVTKKSDNNLEFEVGYLKGLERALELFENMGGGRFIPEFDRSGDHGAHNCKDNAYCEVCGLKL